MSVGLYGDLVDFMVAAHCAKSDEQREHERKTDKLVRQVERAKKSGDLTKPTKTGKLKK